jgi:hypothetical protein
MFVVDADLLITGIDGEDLSRSSTADMFFGSLGCTGEVCGVKLKGVTSHG